MLHISMAAKGPRVYNWCSSQLFQDHFSHLEITPNYVNDRLYNSDEILVKTRVGVSTNLKLIKGI